jgi:ATP/maltotriose-dependent transcriptional regulator MalT
LRYFENLFGRLKPPFILVLDNYQTVPPESKLHDVINDGVSTIPDGINAFVISRHDPPPAWSRLRANEMMKMLGWDDLRLTLEETGGIVPLKAQEIHSKDAIGKPHQAADGWVAGLVLMLESMKRGVEPHLLEKMIPKEILDYFGNEYFNKTEKEIQDFLLKTAFLPQITSKVVDQLTGLSNANSILFRMTNDPWNKKGSQSLKGALDKAGFKKIMMMTAQGPVEAKCQISDDGNKMIIDDGVKHKTTYTRK